MTLTMRCADRFHAWPAILAVWAVAAAGPVQGIEAKTLKRIHDPVVFTGAQLGAILHRQARDVRLQRIANGHAVDIPLQIDQRDRHGDIVVGGPEDFAIDDNDELVFMAADSGDRAAADAWPPECDTVLEITLVDPRDDGRGWAYLLHCPGAPRPKTPAPYVTYDNRSNLARSSAYEAEYAYGRNYLTEMRVADHGSGFGPNLLRQTKMRGVPTFSMLFTTMQLEFTEQTSIVTIDGVKNGPVRAIRKVKLAVDLGKLVPDLPNGTATTYHYRTSFVTPTRFGIPGLLVRMLRDFTFESVVAFSPAAMPVRYWDAGHPNGVPLHAAADAPIVSTTDHEWWVHSGDSGTVLYALTIPDRWRSWGIVRGTVVRDDAAGYSLLNMTHLREGGEYDLMQATVVLPEPYHPGDEAEPMAMLKEPLHTEASRLR